ncbi:SAM-dependent methyltransferase [Streptomyces sp. CB00455]|uniref:class I SAM-dependent methyltransferase n=1 Tax=Streptomyces sp. CB00455 TaxID=1703927 RepID=UPI00093D42A9|nr:class I SAM-dependent methyltransferase [Streptomyces sp. CB00455]OKK16145.1 SAM-dependent methyltransferase [Streptomyces sp. CB00455]
MTTLLPRLFRALDRFHALHPWDHNAHYHRWIMRQLPRHFERALDVGSGSGDLARLLASRATSVQGLDADPAMVARARELTGAALPVRFTAGDALTEIPPGSYDVITCVATLHHLPFSDALTHLRRHLTPGGILVVVGVARAQSRSDHLLGAAAIPMNVAMAWIKSKGRRAPRPVSMTAPTRPATMSFAEILGGARGVLPGVRPRRRLFWRYTLVWHHS